MQSSSRFGVSCSLICLLLTVGCHSAKTDPKAEAEALVHAIQPQSTSAQVISYLEQHDIEHSQLKKNSIHDSSLVAIVRDRSKWKIVQANYGIVFHFDGQNRLRSAGIEPHYTGP